MAKHHLYFHGFCLAAALLSFAPLHSIAQDDELDAEGRELQRRWYQCLAAKGENHPDCQRIQSQFIDLASRKLEYWRDLYRRHCSGPEAQSSYCRNLARKIKELEKERDGYVGGPQERSLFEAQRLASSGKWDDLVARLQVVPERFETHLLLGYAQLERRNWTEAWNHFSAVDRSPPSARSALSASLVKVRTVYPTAMGGLLEADLQARSGRLSDALTTLDRALQLDPHFLPAYELRGLVAIALGRYVEAAADLDKLLAAAPDRPNAIFERAMVDLLVGRFNESVTRLSGLLERHPSFFLARNARGVIYALRAEYDPALEDFEQLQRECPWLTAVRGNKTCTLLFRARGLYVADMEALAKISPKGVLGSHLTMVVADRNSMATATNMAAAAAQQLTGGNVFITSNLTGALAQSRLGRDVIYQRPTGAISSALGDSVMVDLQRFRDNGVSNVGVVGYHADGMNSALWGVRRYLNDPGQMKVSSLTGLEPGGGVNPLALPEHRENARLAQEIMQRGPQVNIFTTQNNFGLARIGEVKAYTDLNVPTFTVKSQSDLSLQLGLGLSRSGLGLSVGPKLTDRIDSVGVNNGLTSLSWQRMNRDGSSFYVTSKSTVDMMNSAGQLNEQFRQLTSNTGAANRSGVFMRLGPAKMDVKTARRTDRSLIDDSVSAEASEPPSGETPDLSYPFLIFNLAPAVPSGPAAGEAKP